MTRVLTILAATLLVLVIVGGVLVITERTASAARAQAHCQDALKSKELWRTAWARGTLEANVRGPIEADIARYCG